MENEWDTKYIPDEFAQEPLHFTPGSQYQGHLDSISEDEPLPYFEQFSYQGSRNSYGHPTYLSASSSAQAASASSEMF